MTDIPGVEIYATIDGRPGDVRESIEKNTDKLRKVATSLIKYFTYYPHRNNIEYVISDTTFWNIHISDDCAISYNQRRIDRTTSLTSLGKTDLNHSQINRNLLTVYNSDYKESGDRTCRKCSHLYN